MNINKYTFFRYYPSLRTKLYVFLRSVVLLVEEVEKYIPREGLIYDIGCGYGLTSLYFALSSAKRKIRGIDIDEKRIDVANDSISRHNLCFEVKNLITNRSINPCDCILMYDLLHHIPSDSQYKLLLACKEKLKQKGILLIKEIDNTHKIKLFITYILDMIVTKNPKFYYNSAKEMIHLLKSIGFDVRYKRLYSIWPYPHYLLICRPLSLRSY